MLDSSLLQYFLVQNGFDTTEITFGANLMMNPLIIDIGKSNKMFKVERPGGSIKEFYRCSKHLSDYIRHVITEKNSRLGLHSVMEEPRMEMTLQTKVSSRCLYVLLG